MAAHAASACIAQPSRAAQSLFGDATRISQVLLNLLGNAVKFTTAGGVIVKAMVVSEDDFFCNAKFEVTDTGIGIAEDEHRYLFVPFSQVDNSTTRKFQGTGLGLTISKRLVELMGGEIGFTSQKGFGSTFWFALPLKKRSAVEPSQQQPSPRALRPKPVLAIEDHPTVQTLIAKQLEMLGMPVEIVGTAEEGLAHLQKEQYALIFMDCNLPFMDGYQAAKQIRKKEQVESKHTPIIGMTAGVLSGDAEKCFAAGMDDFLAKPYTFDQLKEILAKWMPVGSEEETA